MTEDDDPEKTALAMTVGEQMLSCFPVTRFKTGTRGVKLHAYGDLLTPEGAMVPVRVDLQVTILPEKRRRFPVTVTKIPKIDPESATSTDDTGDDSADDTTNGQPSWIVVARGGPALPPE